MTNHPEGYDRISHVDICPKCGKDNLKVYMDGHTHCYSAGCGHHTAGDGETPPMTNVPPKPKVRTGLLSPDPTKAWPKEGNERRRITRDTLTKMGCFKTTFQSVVPIVYQRYNQDGEPNTQKLRMPDKTFPLLVAEDGTNPDKDKLYGQQYFGDRYDRTLVITEGEEDQHAVFQETDGRIAVVSINSGASAAHKDLKENYLWVDRFEEIILWFDNDEAGIAATEACAKMFKVGKVKVARHPEFKDASEVMQADRPGDIKQTIFSAVKWKPKGIVNAADDKDDLSAPKDDDAAFKYNWPWQQLTDYVGPIMPGQVVYHVAGIGVGKTTAVYHIILSLLEQGAKIGCFSFEATRREVKMGLVVVGEGKRLDFEPLSDDLMAKLHDQYFGHRRLELFDPETAEWSMDALESYMRYCIKALDCEILVVDPLSFMVAMSSFTDERQALDQVAAHVAKSAKELGAHIQISHHLARPDGAIGHEEGAPTSLKQMRGSNGLGAGATIVIGHERNQQAGDAQFITQLRALKNRPRSKLGVIMAVEYDPKKGQLTPTHKEFPPPGSSSKDSKGGGFMPIADDGAAY